MSDTPENPGAQQPPVPEQPVPPVQSPVPRPPVPPPQPPVPEQPVPPTSTWGQSALEGAPVRGSIAGSFPGSSGGSPHTPAPGAAGAGSPEAGSAGVSRKRVGPKPIRGPRFSASPLVAGFGLLSILLVVAIMAFLAVKVLGGVDAGTAGVTKGLNSIARDPGATTTPGQQAQPDATTLTDSAKAAQCALNRTVVETAINAYEAMTGTKVTSMDQLVDEGLLAKDPGTFRIDTGPDGATVVGTGVCEGR